MTSNIYHVVDGNEAAARVAYAVSEVIAIYPITPSSTMGEWADQWMSDGVVNLWGHLPEVVEMQSEGGVAGALHGALAAGALVTTFTASQGLLLMIPNMYRIAGELSPMVLHVAARSLATHALSIFGDHSDVMACRATGWAMLCSGSVEEAQDMALIAHAATLESRIPFVHFFDGFRTSHEVAKVHKLPTETIRAMIEEDDVAAHRRRAMNPDDPTIRGTAQNPDVFFQAREAANPWYNACPRIVEETMRRFAQLTGRSYRLFDYVGHPTAERVVVMMGSGADVAHEVVEHLVAKRGERVGLIKVRLYRPFDVHAFVAALPRTVRTIAVLDRSKEPGAVGEPLYLDVVAAIQEAFMAHDAPFNLPPRVVGGRYGLSSKDFTPAMVRSVFDELTQHRPRNHFTVGIRDDVTHTSLDFDPAFTTEDPEGHRAIFFGLGSDGTVGANKNTIKIIGMETDFHAQGYFVYDSKKAGSVTVSHLRFGPRPMRSSYLVQAADFVGCHQFRFLGALPVVETARKGATLLINSPYAPEELWQHLDSHTQHEIIARQLKVYTIDAYAVARDANLGGRINTVMQACFFALSGVLPAEKAVEAMRKAARKTYGKRGEAVVQANIDAIDRSLENLHQIAIPAHATTNGAVARTGMATHGAPAYVSDVASVLMAGAGDTLPVSAFAPDGVFPVGTSRYEKRNIAHEIPVWDTDLCIQCGKCVVACPHSVIRGKLVEADALAAAPGGFATAKSKFPAFPDGVYTLQISGDDCTGCALCVDVCPAKSKADPTHRALNMQPAPEVRQATDGHWDYFLSLNNSGDLKIDRTRIKDLQLLEPLFEFPGACGGCGETPYLKMLTQLWGDRMMVANATGCSSIYGANLPTTPWSKNAQGRGPAWASSLFEDNAEFGLGMRLATDHHRMVARLALQAMAPVLETPSLVDGLLNNPQKTEEEVARQRADVQELNRRLASLKTPEARSLMANSHALVERVVWIIGGDGWAYDIGFGGLDHVLASGANVNVLVMDTEVYSNTGGQSSKATPRGAVARFATNGRPSAKKDLALQMMTYGNVYVARVALGANDAHTLRVLQEAQAFNGPSLVIAYCHCVAHGFDLSHGFQQQKAAVESGHWLLMRYNPALAEAGSNPLTLDCKDPKLALKDYAYAEDRYSMLSKREPESAAAMIEMAQMEVHRRWKFYQGLRDSLATTEN